MSSEQRAALCEASNTVSQRLEIIILSLDQMLAKRSERRKTGAGSRHKL